jgi:hypothetical protein
MLRDNEEVAKEVMPKIKECAWRCFCTEEDAPANIKEKEENLKYMEDMKKYKDWEEYMSKERMVIDVDEFEKEGWGENADEEELAKFVCKYMLPKISKAFKKEMDNWKKRGIKEDRVAFENGGIRGMTRSDEAFAIVFCMFELRKELYWNELKKIAGTGRQHEAESWQGPMYRKSLKRVVMWLKEQYEKYEEYRVGGEREKKGVEDMEINVLSNWHKGMMMALREAAGENVRKDRKVAAKGKKGGKEKAGEQDESEDEYAGLNLYAV